MTEQTQRNIPLAKASIGKEEEEAMIETLRSGWLTHGDKNKIFEKQFAEFIGVKHAISMNSCTAALFLAIKANDIAGEVILPSFTFSASANAIVTAGATPVFADIDEQTGMLDPKSVEAAITDKTQAVMVVHFAGQSADIGALKSICDKHNLVFIEDSAEAIGAEYNGGRTGSFGFGCFSFFPTKNITCGEGGMFTTNDDELAKRVSVLMAHGIEKAQNPPFSGFRSASVAGYNFRLSNILAAIGVEQMKKIDRFNARRREIATLYNELLSQVEQVKTPVEKDGRVHVYQMYTIRVESETRNQLLNHLIQKGVGASVHFSPPVHLQEYYRDKFTSVPLPVTERLHNEILTLPIFTEKTNDEERYVCDQIKVFFD